ncbi:MAG: LysM peptidoglycan-binding domain-containing protein, partial [Cyclobacteriaceae bacterium]
MQLLKPLFSVAILILSISSAKGNDSLRIEEINGKRFVIHEIDQGETLYALSRRYNASVEDISQQNELQNYAISVGQILTIPLKEYKISGILHTVDQGETLYRISKAYDVSVVDLKRWNNLVDNNISVGQKLSIGSQMPDDAPLYQDELDNSKPFVEEDLDLIEEDVKLRKVGTNYYVQAGESLA